MFRSTSAHSGAVIWITGLSGAGKTTIGREVEALLRQSDQPVAFLDGDQFREIMGGTLGHEPADRLLNAYRIARMSAYLASQGIVVVCATMSLFPEIWSWNREHITRYFEVFLDVSKETLLARDPKGLYARAAAGRETNIVGWDLNFDAPALADLIIKNDSLAPSEAHQHALMIVDRFEKRYSRA